MHLWWKQCTNKQPKCRGFRADFVPKCLAKEKQPKILPRYCSEVTWRAKWCPLQCLEDLWRPGKTYQILCRPIIDQWYTSSSTRCLSNGIKMGWKWDELVIKYFKCSDIRVYWVYWKSVPNLMWTEGVTGCNRLTCRFVQRSWMVLVSSGVIWCHLAYSAPILPPLRGDRDSQSGVRPWQWRWERQAEWVEPKQHVGNMLWHVMT